MPTLKLNGTTAAIKKLTADPRFREFIGAVGVSMIVEVDEWIAPYAEKITTSFASKSRQFRLLQALVDRKRTDAEVRDLLDMAPGSSLRGLLTPITRRQNTLAGRHEIPIGLPRIIVKNSLHNRTDDDTGYYLQMTPGLEGTFGPLLADQRV